MSGVDNPLRSALFTDFYELTMARAYAAEDLTGSAVFEAFFRNLPPHRSFVLAAGLDDILTYLETLHFTTSDLDYLAGLGQFPEDFLESLRGLRFTGDVWAMPEGTAVFPGEPLVQVRASLLEAQLVETLLLNQLHIQSVAATKAARMVLAARGRTVVDFGARRAHGADAALKAARAACLAGAAGTSNTLAGKLYGVPVYGTMAHSYVQAHADESEAFRRFVSLYPETTLLVDTYDTLAGVDRVIALARELGDAFRVRFIRLDSGNLEALSRACRDRLDRAGLTGVRIFATCELDEYAIADLVARGAPIDGFGVGTRLVISADAPSLDVVYKLVEFGGVGRAKLSQGKKMHPGPKQVRRTYEDGVMRGDLVCRAGEDAPGEPLLVEVMRAGVRTPAGRVPLADSRERARATLAALPEDLRGPNAPARAYPVEFSESLRQELAAIREGHGGQL